MFRVFRSDWYNKKSAKISFIITLLAILLFVFSCSKEDTTPQSNSATSVQDIDYEEITAQINSTIQETDEYTAESIYKDVLFFEERVDSDEKTLFYQNYQSIGDAILDACKIYFPDIPLKHCSRIFVATTLKESTFNKYEIHEADNQYPTLGLLQIRKSSTVYDYYDYSNTGYLQERDILFENPTNEQMQNILYNIHLGMWYISIHARSNARYAKEYCTKENNDTGAIAVGLSSHRIGPTAYQEGSQLETAEGYVNWIKTKYLELFTNEGIVPEEDYFSKPLAYLSSLCA